MVRKFREEYTKTGLQVNFDKTEYLTTNEGILQNLKIDEDGTIKGMNGFK